MFQKTNLETIIIPRSITGIGQYALSSCPNLKKVVLPEGLTIISGLAFRYCSQLDDVNFPSTLVSIWGNAFKGTGFKSLSFPSQLRILEVAAFQDCIHLERVELPRDLNSIYWSAFLGCTSLKTVIARNPVPPSISDDTFDEVTYQTATLYVPSEGMDAYLKHSRWQKFMRVTEGEPSSVGSIDSDNIRISVNGNKVLIAGTTWGDVVNVYTVGGSLVETVHARGPEVEVELISGGVYLVKIGERTYKVGV